MTSQPPSQPPSLPITAPQPRGPYTVTCPTCRWRQTYQTIFGAVAARHGHQHRGGGGGVREPRRPTPPPTTLGATITP